MAWLELRGLDFGLELIKDDRYKIYHNKDRNVTILAIAYDVDEEADEVFDAIADENYLPLIDFMNKNDNLIIKWTKIGESISDYEVYCDADYQSYCSDWNIIDLNEYLDVLRLWQKSEAKYIMIKDGYMFVFEYCMDNA